MPGGSNLSDRTKAIVVLVVVAAYAIFPADVIPDAMLGLGQLDDIIVFALGVIVAVGKLRKRGDDRWAARQKQARGGLCL